ncbi:NitT/TauT family transport system permease protein [Antricoccus suffuscus]|uniref:NitT/TauT family transport system permease protein n=1 Tax=Antricoccus suffuscus TaxID=1629062 RepID=A0A2T1A5W0_9ACTN|nr:ABC transporter permease [Antricoccus suffuscus]PRZ43976.1 NitT/TauT family transport system permease protein [Antricoccus suffuscus]
MMMQTEAKPTSSAATPDDRPTPTRSFTKPRRRLHEQRRIVFPLQIAVFVLIVAVWEIAARTGIVEELYVSKPSSIAAAFWHSMISGELVGELGTTLYETLVGFAIAAILGIGAGLLMYQIPLLNAVVQPYLTAFNNLPRLALAPLFVLWFGLASMSKIVLVVSLCFFIVTFNTYAGLQNANRDHLLLAKTLGAKRFTLFRKFVLPSAVPTTFAGLQLALTYAFLSAVVGEMLSGSSGLGAVLQLALTSYRTEDFFATLLLLVVVATIFSGVMRLVERRILRWKQYELQGVEN